MAQVKKTLKKIGRQIWELFKSSLPAGLMYVCAGAVLVMLTLKGDVKELRWDSGKLLWSLVCIIVPAAYNGLISYAHGGSGYEMLVTGNVKRVSAYGEDGGYKMSKHVQAKEYRVWKGFAIGGFMAIIPLVTGLIFGARQGEIDAMLANLVAGEESAGTIGSGFGIVLIISLFLSGWTLLPLFIPNAGGAGISYYFGCLFALIPIAVTGVMYIVGAYGKRRKTLREQEIADKAAQAEANREKKINYGGLPGTKPKKRK